MPNYTQHFNLIKPKKTENYDIEDVTTKNMDILDEELFGKEDKVPGKGLSTNDFTDAYKNKLDELKNYDDTEIKNNLNEQVQKNNLQEQEIEELQGKITNLKEENTQLKNQIPIGEVEGEYINIKDSSNLELVDFNVEGKTEQDGIPTVELPVEIKGCGEDGNISVVKSNGNLAKIREDNFELTENNTIKSTKRANNIRVNDSIKIKAGQTVKARFKLLSKPSTATSFTCNINELTFASFNNFSLNQNYDRTWTATEDSEIYYTAWGDANNETFEFQLSVSIDEAIDYIKHEDKEYIIQTQEPFYEGDKFVKIDGVRYEKHNYAKKIFDGTENWVYDEKYNYFRCPTYNFSNKIPSTINENQISNMFTITSDWGDSFRDKLDMDVMFWLQNAGYKICIRNTAYKTTEDFKGWLLELYNSGKPLYVVYPLEEPVLIECTPEQNAVLDEIEADGTYKNITYIYSNDEIEPKIKLQYYKDLETLINRAGGQ